MWLNVVTRSIKPQTQKEIGRYDKGTTVTFHDPYEDRLNIDPKEVYKRIQKSFGLKFMKNPKLIAYVNGKKIEPLPHLQNK